MIWKRLRFGRSENCIHPGARSKHHNHIHEGGATMKALNIVLTVALVGIMFGAFSASAQPGMFYYSGRLTDDTGQPVDDMLSIVFSVYDGASDGTPLWTETHPDVVVESGSYSVLLGSVNPIPSSVFAGGDRWLGIKVSTDSEMTPRQCIAGVPYAINADMVDGKHASDFGGDGHSLDAADGDPVDAVYVDDDGKVGVGTTTPAATVHMSGSEGFISQGTFGTGASLNLGAGTRLHWYPKKAAFRAGGIDGTQWDEINIGDYSTVSGGQNNMALHEFGTVAGGSGNSLTGEYTAGTIAGGQGNNVSANFGTVGGGRGNWAQNDGTVSGGQNNHAGGVSSVGGGFNNDAKGGATTIGGGANNIAEGIRSTVAGGESNQAIGVNYSTVCGGQSNLATADRSFVGGGSGNEANGALSTVTGGHHNKANGGVAFVGGGDNNIAGGAGSVVPGGYLNASAGDFSFAAGQKAKADHNGTFVWSDGQVPEFRSTAANQFLIHADGGVGIGKTNPECALDVAGTIQGTGFQMETGASEGYVLTSDASGVGAWQQFVGTGVDNDWEIVGNDMYSNVSGNVGIGTSSPWDKLTIKSATSDRIVMLRNENDIPRLFLGHTSGNDAVISAFDGMRFLMDVDNNAIGSYFAWERDGDSENATELMRLTNDGNVGIGTSSPGAKLEVNGQIKITGGSPGTGKVLTSNASGLASWETPSGSGIGGSGTDNYLPKFTSATTLGNSVVYEEAGNIGIGTATPNSKLEVEGGNIFVDQGFITIWANNHGLRMREASNTDYRWQLGMDGDGNFRVDQYGNGWASIGNRFAVSQDGSVGIGTTSPTHILHIVDEHGDGEIKLEGASTKFIMIDTNEDDASRIQIGPEGRKGLAFFVGCNPATGTQGLEALYMQEDGNVGLGTTIPEEKLDVNGTIQTAGFKMPTGAGNGYVLTSNAEGVATWQQPTSSPPGGGEDLRIVRGNISESGAIEAGSGFTCVWEQDDAQHAHYRITFSPPFSGVPTATVSARTAQNGTAWFSWAVVLDLQPDHMDVRTGYQQQSLTMQSVQKSFTFIAVGPK